MKKLSISLALMAIISFGHSQNSYLGFGQGLFDDLGLAGSNNEYLVEMRSDFNLIQNKYQDNGGSYRYTTFIEESTDPFVASKNSIQLSTGIEMKYIEKGIPEGKIILLLHGLTAPPAPFNR